MPIEDNSCVQFVDRRKFGRKSVRIGARAIIANADATIDCTILDISESGARLELNNVDIITARFKLYVPDIDYIHNCEVVWRNTDQLGVKFANTMSL